MENNTNDWTIGDHLENFNNPHEVTKAQVGLGNVDNVRQYSELNPPPNHINTVCGKGPDANGDIDLVKGDVNLGKVDNVKQYSEKNPPPYPVTSVNGQTGAVNIALPDTSGLQTAINTHTANVCNPHQVTKEQVGLGNVDNTSDLEKPISTAIQSALDSKLNVGVYTAADVLNKIKTVDGAGSGLDADLVDGRNAANAANSIPILDATGKLPIAQIPTGATASTVSLGNHGHSNYAASSHSHSYLPLAGGTVTGTTNFGGGLNHRGNPVANYTPKIYNFTPVLGYTSEDDSGIHSYSCNYDTKYNYSKYCRVGNLISITIYMLVKINTSPAVSTYAAVIRNFPYIPQDAVFAPAFITGGLSYYWSTEMVPGNTPLSCKISQNGYMQIHTASGVNGVTWRQAENSWIWLSLTYPTNY